jgi:hypothetical protein
LLVLLNQIKDKMKKVFLSALLLIAIGFAACGDKEEEKGAAADPSVCDCIKKAGTDEEFRKICDKKFRRSDMTEAEKTTLKEEMKACAAEMKNSGHNSHEHDHDHEH